MHRLRVGVLSVVAISGSAFFTERAHAQSWIGANNAPWDVAANWNPASAPNSSSANVTINNATTAAIVGGLTRVVNNLTIGSTSGVTLLNGSRLSFHGTINNAGTINMQSTGTPTYLQPVGNVSLNGSGVLLLTPNVNNVIADLTNTNGANDTLNIGTGFTIRGGATIGNANTLAINNAGTIETLNTSAFTINLLPSSAGLNNTGTIRAVGSGLVVLDGLNNGTFTNSSGTIGGGTGIVRLVSGARIVGGNLAATTTFRIQDLGTYESLTHAGITVLNNGASLNAVGTIVNNGSITVSGPTTNTYFRPKGVVTLNGTGFVRLIDNNEAWLVDLTDAVNDHLINGSTHTVGGFGSIGTGAGTTLAFTNNGILAADTNAGRLRIRTSSFVHQGTMRAVNGATLSIEGPVSGAGISDIQTGGTLELNGATGTLGAASGGGKILATGAITQVRLASMRVETIEVASGATLGISASGSAGASKVSTFTLLPAQGGKFDVNASGLVINYSGASPAATIRQLLVNGRGTGNWQGSGGITSTFAQANPSYGVGFAEASQIGNPATFMGQTVDSTSILISAANYGDTNLDGNVDFSDLLALAQNYGQNARSWVHGDSNYDNVVDFADLLSLAQNYGTVALNGVADLSTFEADWALAQSMVPEPSTLLLALAPLCVRRRRSARCFA